jgi:hypothetical protein
MASETNPTSLLMPPSPTVEPAAPEPAEPVSRPRRVPWIGLTLAVALLATSGAVRAWQSWGVNEALRQGRESPFPLGTLPMTLGDWNGEARELDPEIARKTGCSDHVFRSYRNKKTGSRIDLILLYGPSLEVVKHSPIICYPDAGFTYMAQPESRVIEAGRKPFPFSSMVFTKGDDNQAVHEEVYYTWGQARPGQPGIVWAPDVGIWKRLARVPGLYKVHLQRIVGPLERREFGNPCEAFLTELMPWIERQYDQAEQARQAQASGQTRARPARST